MQLNSFTVMDLISDLGTAIGIIFALLEFQAGHISLSQAVIYTIIRGNFLFLYVC
ncbi:hypothetical protein [Brevinema andersonii]|uniref:hypothetical protein n=1 Tax=Brevinema andersonii TaxID=34097 RepID=UPI0013565A20|nr:hypothetical protein [Brevinema andersonii]